MFQVGYQVTLSFPEQGTHWGNNEVVENKDYGIRYSFQIISSCLPPMDTMKVWDFHVWMNQQLLFVTDPHLVELQDELQYNP